MEKTTNCDDAIAMRLMVLEMTIAIIAARLPKGDMEEVASALVFVAKCSNAASEMASLPPDSGKLELASHYATEMLERMTKVRRSTRNRAKQH
jgi:hypothetical protein